MVRPFEGVLGNTCEMRLLEFLLPLSDMEFNVTELSEEAGVSRVTVGRVVKKFVEWGVLTQSGAKIPLYSINSDSPIVRSIEDLNNSLIERMLGEEKMREIRDFIQERSIAKVKIEVKTNTKTTPENNHALPVSPFGWGAGDGCCVPAPGVSYGSVGSAMADLYSESNRHPEHDYPRYQQ